MNATWLAVSEEDLRGNEGSGSDYGQDWDLPHKFLRQDVDDIERKRSL